MRRREFLKIAVPAVVTPGVLVGQQAAPPPPAPVPWTLGLNPSTPLPETVVADEAGAATIAKFFSAKQMATMQKLAGILLPPVGGRPGAVEVGVPQFLDFLIGSSPDARKGLYTGGLDWVDAQANGRFGRGFADLSDQDAGTLLQPWLRTWMSDHPPEEPHADFVNIAHADIRRATVNSKQWSDAQKDKERETTPVALFWQPIEPDLHGVNAVSAQTPPPTQAAPKAEHTVPSYPR